MSRLGKKPILIPEKVEIRLDNGTIFVKGPLGELQKCFDQNKINISIKDGEVFVALARDAKGSAVLIGSYVSHIKNMIEGASNGFSKRLIIEGIGYRAQSEGSNLSLNVGLSHPVKIAIPKGIKVAIEKNIITVSGAEKELIGQFAAKIRDVKRAEPYKGKGIRYEGEIIRRKAGKKAAAAAA